MRTKIGLTLTNKITPLKFKFILITALLMLSLFGFSQQEINVKGVVTEMKTRNPAIEATVLVKGTTIGAVIDDNYSLSSIPSNATLEFSYIGMTSIEETVNRHTTINVVLTKDIADRPSANPLASLQGKIAGVQCFASSKGTSQR